MNLADEQDELPADAAACFQPIPTIHDDASANRVYTTANDWIPWRYATATILATAADWRHGVWKPAAHVPTAATISAFPAIASTAFHATYSDWIPI